MTAYDLALQRQSYSTFCYTAKQEKSLVEQYQQY